MYGYVQIHSFTMLYEYWTLSPVLDIFYWTKGCAGSGHSLF